VRYVDAYVERLRRLEHATWGAGDVEHRTGAATAD